MIIKGLKVHESLNEIECMLKYLEKLHTLWKFNEENFNCHLGVNGNKFLRKKEKNFK